MMRTTDYSTVLKQTATFCGLDRNNLSTDEFEILRDFHNTRLQTAWEFHYWPDLMAVEQRFFRLAYDAALTYAATDERYYPFSDTYYQALTAVPAGQTPEDADGNTNLAYWAECEPGYSADTYDPDAVYVQGAQAEYGGNFYQLFAVTATGVLPTDATQWGLLTDFDRYIAYAQTGETQLEDVFECYNASPKLTTKLSKLNWYRSENGIQILSPATFAWVEFRQLTPNLTGDVLDTTAAYVANDQAYFTTSAGKGNFYNANQAAAAGETPETHPAKWDIVEIPLIFQRYLDYGAAADYFRMEKQYDAANEYQVMADGNDSEPGELGKQKTLLTDQQGNRQRPVVLTR